MRDSLRLGRIAGIPVTMNWSVAVVVVVITYVLTTSTLAQLFPSSGFTARLAVAVGGALVFLASLIGHELGHAVVARRNGVGVEGITLWLLGGFARLDRQAPTPGAEFRIAAAGPAANVVIAIVLAGVLAVVRAGSWPELVAAVVLWLAVVNLLLAVSNLLPGAPLDGGRILTAAIWRRTGDAELARLRSARAGLTIAAAVAVLGLLELNVWSRREGWATLFVGLFIAVTARSEISGAATRRRLAATSLASVMWPHPEPVHESMTVEHFLHSHGRGPDVARPVTRWDTEPIGYMAPYLAGALDVAARSWTTLGHCMVPATGVPRAWTSETVAALMERSGGEMPPMVVLHEPQRGTVVGTLSRAQVRELINHPADFWGRERSEGRAAVR